MRPLNWDINSENLKKMICKTIKKANKYYESSAGKNPYSTALKDRSVKRIVSNRFKVVYIENPLSASRSIITKLKSEDKDTIETRREIRDNKFIKFSVCRNPWERLVSCYNKKVLNANNIKKIAIISQYEGLHPQMSFGAFLQWLISEEGKDKNADPHWATQHRILTGSDGQLSCDEVLRLENLKSQFASFSEKVGFQSSDLPLKASSESQMYGRMFEDYRKYYYRVDKKVLKKVSKKYKTDCKLFGYPSLSKYLNK
jgi:hypothetical protein